MTPHDLLAHFEVLAEAPNGIQRLRELVLELAVRGKLVEQDPADEPASELLKRSRVEKKRLVKEGITRGGDPPQSVGAEEQPFEVPSNWDWARMDEICSIKGGVTKGRNVHGRETEEYPYLRVANVQAGFIDLSVLKTIPLPMDELEDYRLLVGDVLLTEGGDWDKLGRSAVWAGEVDPCIHQNHIFRARPLDEGLQSRWLSGFTNSPDGRHHFQSCSKQTTNLASINMTQLKCCPVPVPPYGEQVRILARVDELMALLDRLDAKRNDREASRAAARDSALAALREAATPDDVEFAWIRVQEKFQELFTTPKDIAPLRQTILSLAVRGRLIKQDPRDGSAGTFLERIRKGRVLDLASKAQDPPYEVPSQWLWTRFSEVATIDSDLVDPSKYQDSLHIAPDNIEKFTGKLLPYRTIAQDAITSSNHRFHAGQILYSKIRPNLSKAVKIDFSGLCSADMYPLSTDLNQSYFHYFLLSDPFLAQVTTGDNRVAMPKVNQQQLNLVLVPIPPLKEQSRIVACVDELMSHLNRLENSINNFIGLSADFSKAAVHHIDL